MFSPAEVVIDELSIVIVGQWGNGRSDRAPCASRRPHASDFLTRLDFDDTMMDRMRQPILMEVNQNNN